MQKCLILGRPLWEDHSEDEELTMMKCLLDCSWNLTLESGKKK